MTAYKQTELGLIPSDWEVVELQNLTTFGGGTTPSRRLFDKYFKQGTRYWVKTLDLNNSLITYTDEKITNLALKETSLKEYPIGTVLVAMYGGFNQIGRTGLLAIPASINQALVAILPSSNITPYYLIQNLNFNIEYWKSVASSSRKDPNITSNDVKKYKLSLPKSTAEQTAIATALSDTDALLAELEKLLAKKQAIKTATMQQLLTGKTRLPEFAHRADGTPKGSLKTEWGDIPEDWEVVELGDICHYKNGMALEYLFNKYDGYNVISIGNYSLNSKYLGNDTYISKTYKYQINKFIVKKDELTMILNDKTSSGEIIGRVLLIEEDDKYVINQRSLILAPKKHLSKYLYYYLNSDYCRRMVFKEAKPGTQIYINTGDVLGLKIIISKSTTEQTAIAQILGDMDSEITALQARIEKLREIKQGMMQNLLTGKIRLPC